MSVNFTPSMGSIKDMKPFKFWCQKVLPTVYDDSLSYYELLCKVVQYLNDNVDNINLLNDNVTNLYNAYVALQEYVNNYFDQNFPELVSDKLDEMAEDGTLTALIQAYIDPYFEEKSDEIDEAISAQNDSIDLLSTQMSEFIADHAGLVTETVLWSGEGSGDGFVFNLSDSASNYNYIDVHVDFTSLVTGTKLTYKGGVLRFNSQDFATGKCMITIPVVNPNTSDIGVLEMRFTPDGNVANRYTLVGCKKVTADTNGFQLEVVTAGLPAGTSANDPSCGGITKIVGVKNTQNDQEIINARIGADGTVYNTLGDSIRGQCNKLSSYCARNEAYYEYANDILGVIVPYNIFNKNDDSEGYIDGWILNKTVDLSTGNLVTSASNIAVTYLIPVYNKKRVSAKYGSGQILLTMRHVCAYDVAGNLIGASDTNVTNYELPSGTYYVRIEHTYGSHIERLYNKITVCDDSTAGTPYEDYFSPYNSNRKPMNYMQIFQTYTTIGDSLMGGFMNRDGVSVSTANAKEAGNNWVNYIASRIGRNFTNLAVGGSTAKSWRESLLNTANTPTECYIIGLGVNDHRQSLPIGTADDIAVNFVDNADSFYGNYDYILRQLMSWNNKAHIFCFTIPNIEGGTSSDYNTAIRAICALYPAKVHCIDLALSYAPYFAKTIITDNYSNNHFNPVSYNYMSSVIELAIDDYISSFYNLFATAPYA